MSHPAQPGLSGPAQPPGGAPQRPAAAPTWEQPVHDDPASAPDARYEHEAPAAPQGLAPAPGQGGPAWQGTASRNGDPYGSGSAVTADHRADPRGRPLSRGFLAGLLAVCLVIVLGVGIGGWAGASHFLREEEVPPDGTHAHPYVVGTEAVTVKTSLGTASIELGTPDWDAYPELHKASRTTDEAPDGEVYILIPVKVTNTGAGRITGGSVAEIEYQTESGEEFPQKWVTVPRSAGYGEMTENMSQEFDMAFLVPAEGVESGRFRVTGALEEETFWFRAA